ncbi:MAG: hypothetical protein ABWY27_10115 [Telluria sp.]
MNTDGAKRSVFAELPPLDSAVPTNLPFKRNAIMSPHDRLVASAKDLRDILDKLDSSKPLLSEASAILRQIIDQVLSGQAELPKSLPNRAFFSACMSIPSQRTT